MSWSAVKVVRWWRSKERTWFFFALPTIVTLGAIVIYPLIYVVFMSFHSYNFVQDVQPVFNGLQNYINVLTRGRFTNALLFTGRYIGLAVSAQIVIGFGIALLLYQDLRGFRVLRALLLLPLMLTPVVTGLIWTFMYNNEYGLVRYLGGLIGIKKMPIWFNSPLTALTAIVVVDCWQFIPFAALILLAGLQSVPVSLIESAQLDGASYRHVVFHVIIPWLKGVFLVICLVRVVGIYKVFAYVWELTKGGPGRATETPSYTVYICAFWELEIGYASTLAVLTLVVGLTIGGFLIKQLVRR